MPGYQRDVVVIGGSLGGCAAALAAARLGQQVIMTEETDWIGGQLTSQAVPPDEHRWIEQFGCTALYRDFRQRVRDYYCRNFPLTAKAQAHTHLNPGDGSVSRLCHEPKVALAVLYEMLAPYLSCGRVTLLLQHKPVDCLVVGERIVTVTVRNLVSGEVVELQAPYFLDATELGDLLPLAGCEYVVGAESIQETGEPHAVAGEAQPSNQQGITYCFAMDHLPGTDQTIARPATYDFWRSYQPDFWPDKLLSWTTAHPITLEPFYHYLFPEDAGDRHSLWRYRQIASADNHLPGTYVSHITLVNWPQNDYWLGPIVGGSDTEVAEHLQAAKELSFSLLYWMQTEAPRLDGGVGYPGLRLRGDLLGSDDGLAKYPYVRESRRIRAEFTVVEQHVAAAIRGDRGAEKFADTVGVGCYRIDLHPSTGGDTYIDVGSWPFQIPLGSLLPLRVQNLLPACKNLGVTHITNGCYRLHPVEWNIGEVSGYLAAFCLEGKLVPSQVRHSEEQLARFQQLLVTQGIELDWPRVHPV